MHFALSEWLRALAEFLLLNSRKEIETIVLQNIWQYTRK